MAFIVFSSRLWKAEGVRGGMGQSECREELGVSAASISAQLNCTKKYSYNANSKTLCPPLVEEGAPEFEQARKSAEGIVAAHITWEEQTGKIANEDVDSKTSNAHHLEVP
jgi:hypothetical protein